MLRPVVSSRNRLSETVERANRDNRLRTCKQAVVARRRSGIGRTNFRNSNSRKFVRPIPLRRRATTACLQVRSRLSRLARSTVSDNRFRLDTTGRSMDCYVYVLGTLANNRHLTYVGWTDNVERRLAQHNAGKGARSTRGRSWVLLYSERCASKRHAMSREWHLKRSRALRRELAMKQFGG